MLKTSLLVLGLAVSTIVNGQTITAPKPKFDPAKHATTLQQYYEQKEPVTEKLFLSIVEYNLEHYKDTLPADDYAILERERKALREYKVATL